MKFVLEQYDKELRFFDLRSEASRAFAPIFDNGMAFFPFGMNGDFRGLAADAKPRTPVFGASFAKLAAALITDRQRKKLRKLIDFRFTRDRNYNLPSTRLKGLKSFLQSRFRTLGEMRI